jgi:hypothetical protein
MHMHVHVRFTLDKLLLLISGKLANERGIG